MGSLLKAELQYNLPLIIVYHVLIVVVGCYEIIVGSDQGGLAAIMVHLVLFLILQNRIREKLERMQVLLPLSALKIGTVRVLLLSIPVFSIYFIYFIVHRLGAARVNVDYWRLVFLGGIFLFLYFLFCLARDFYFSFGRERIFRFIVICLTTLSIGVGIIFTIFILMANMNFFEKINSILAEFLFVVLFFLLIFMALISIYSFSHRKSYL